MTKYDKIKNDLQKNPKIWLITGVAGFIGSNLLEELLKLDQTVIGMDNFITGYQHNLDEVETAVTSKQWDRFSFVKGDICNLEDCHKAVKGVDYVLHQAALGSVPRSIRDPITTNEINNSGFLNMMVAARDAKVKSFIYAASSSTYGDHPELPKVEKNIGNPLSPYAVTKYVNELYAAVFSKNYGFNSIGLRYFNVYGKRQDTNSSYSAVIPKWIAALIRNEPVYIYGDGETSRDFCYVDNVVQANILAAISNNKSINQVLNIAVSCRTTLNDLFQLLHGFLMEDYPYLKSVKPVYQNYRSGDVRHSLADISKAKEVIGYCPMYNVADGIKETMNWYILHLGEPVQINE